MKPLVSVKQVSKNYRDAKSQNKNQALQALSFELYPGQILGLLGHNGAGKSTLINALLGAHRYEGDITINGCHPINQHAKLMERLAYISDVNVLPNWMRVSQLLKYTAGVHPSFDIEKAKQMLSNTEIGLSNKIQTLSKGMKVQLHLAIVIATDTNVLILDEPTLGLDLLYRDTFYRHLLEWFHDGERTLVIASHEVSEIEHLLTDVLILKQGITVLQGNMEEVSEAYFILDAATTHNQRVTQMDPLDSQTGLGTVKWLLKSQYREEAETLGDCHRATLADLFLALQRETA